MPQYDVVVLSLVVNFVGDPRRRALMVREAARLARGGLLFLVLPSACVNNSRYCDKDTVRAIMAAAGAAVVEERESSKLWMAVAKCAKPSAEAAAAQFPRRLVRKGQGQMNTFCMIVGEAKAPPAPKGDKKRTSNQRKRDRKKKAKAAARQAKRATE